jgi:RNA polymerase sigma-70 factor (ECF subfamily)
MIDLIQAVTAMQNGDKTAFDALYSEYSQPTYFLALKLMKNPQEAEDITQDVFLTAFRKIGELKAPENFPAWLKRITVNKCSDILKKNNVLTAVSGDTAEIEFIEEINEEHIPELSLDKKATADIIVQIVDKLPLPQRVCVYFYYYERLTVKEIAEHLAVSENTVKTRLSLAREKIRKELEELEDKEGLKLYMAMPLLLIPAIRLAMENTHVPGNILSRITDSFSITASAATAAETTAAVTTVETAATATTTAAAVSGKTIAAVIAGVVVTGGIIAAVVIASPWENSEPAIAVETRRPRQTEEIREPVDTTEISAEIIEELFEEIQGGLEDELPEFIQFLLSGTYNYTIYYDLDDLNRVIIYSANGMLARTNINYNPIAGETTFHMFYRDGYNYMLNDLLWTYSKNPVGDYGPTGYFCIKDFSVDNQGIVDFDGKSFEFIDSMDAVGGHGTRFLFNDGEIYAKQTLNRRQNNSELTVGTTYYIVNSTNDIPDSVFEIPRGYELWE